MTVRVLHTADWHLGASFAVFGEAAARRREDQRGALERIVKHADEQSVDAVLIAGDLFDSTRPDEQARETARDIFDALAIEGIPAFTLPGTHDHTAHGGGAVCWEHDNLVWFNQAQCDEPRLIETEDEPLWLYGLTAVPGRRAEIDSLRRREHEGVHIGLLHATLIHGSYFTAAHKDIPVRAADLARLRLDYLALGHYHGAAPIEHEGRLIGAYAGSPAALRFGEMGPRTAYLVEIDDGETKIEPLDVGVGQCLDLRLDVSAAEDDEAILRLLAAHAGDDVYARFRLNGLLDKPLAGEELAARLAPKFAHLVLVDETDLSHSEWLRQVAGEPTVRGHAVGALLMRLDAATENNERRLLKRALQSLLAAFDRHPLERRT